MVRSAAVAVAVVVCRAWPPRWIRAVPEAMAALLADRRRRDRCRQARSKGLLNDPAWPDLEGFALSHKVVQSPAGVSWTKTSTLVGFTLAVPDPPIPSDTLSPRTQSPSPRASATPLRAVPEGARSR